jgi:hypothetical protein
LQQAQSFFSMAFPQYQASVSNCARKGRLVEQCLYSKCNPQDQVNDLRYQ